MNQIVIVVKGFKRYFLKINYIMDLRPRKDKT